MSQTEREKSERRSGETSGKFLLLNMQKHNHKDKKRRGTHIQTPSRTNICSPTADPQSLFPSPWENSREKEENVLFCFFLIAQTICPNLQRDASHHHPYSFTVISTEPTTHTPVDFRVLGQRCSFICLSELQGGGRCVCVCVSCCECLHGVTNQEGAAAFNLCLSTSRIAWEICTLVHYRTPLLTSYFRDTEGEKNYTCREKCSKTFSGEISKWSEDLLLNGSNTNCTEMCSQQDPLKFTCHAIHFT